MIAVTATSFMRDPWLCQKLETVCQGRDVRYFDLRIPEQKNLFLQARNLSAWLVGSERVSRAELSHFPQLQIVAKYGVGVDNIDFAALKERGISWVWKEGVNRDAVAEHSLGLILALTRKIAANSRLLAAGQWNKNGGRSLSALKVGIIGFGHVGQRLAEILKVFACDMRYCDIQDKSSAAQALGISSGSYREILSWADILTFHVPLTEQSYRMFDKEALSLVKPGTILINTSRGTVIDQSLLPEALKTGVLGGVGLDVFEVEPLHSPELAQCEGFVGTPHTAGNSQEAVRLMGGAAIEGLAEWLKKADINK